MASSREYVSYQVGLVIDDVIHDVPAFVGKFGATFADIPFETHSRNVSSLSSRSLKSDPRILGRVADYAVDISSNFTIRSTDCAKYGRNIVNLRKSSRCSDAVIADKIIK